MSKYAEMSDFEINKLVAEKLDEAFLLPYIVTFNDSNEVVYLCEKDGISSIYPIAHFDPCNNPSDAWPIILENRINIKHLSSSDTWVAEESKDICVYSINENPLRAAMIVYLMLEGDI